MTSLGGSSSADDGSIARKIHFLVNTHRTTVQDLAAALNVRREVLQDIIDGRMQPPSSLLEAMASHFGVTPDFFRFSEPLPKKTATGQDFPVKATPRQKNKSRSLGGMKALAVRHQALLEALISTGILSAADYHQHILKVEQRQDG